MIKWVRSVIERTDKDETKIYLIQINEEVLTPDKELFYLNNRIEVINIMNNDVTEHLKSETKANELDDTYIKQVMELFLQYISDNNLLHDKTQLALDQAKRNQYLEAWKGLQTPFINEKLDVNTIADQLEDIINKRQKAKLHIYQHHKFNGLRIHYHKSQEKLNDKLTLVLLYGIQDCSLTLSRLIKEEKCKQIENSGRLTGETQILYYKLKRREQLLWLKLPITKDMPNGDNEAIYEQILISSFNLNFKRLKQLLLKWHPRRAKWQRIKATFLYLFDENEAKETFRKLYYKRQLTSEEYLPILELYQRINYPSEYLDEDHPKLKKQIKQFEDTDIRSISQIIESFDNKPIKKVIPYGKGKFSTSYNSFAYSSSFTIQEKGVQLIQYLIEMGLIISLPQINLISYSKAYPLFKELVELYPFPTLFYALQFSNQDFLKRLGQDFAYSKLNHQQGTSNTIAVNLLKAYQAVETPESFKENTLYFMSSFITGIHPKIWEDDLRKIWLNKNFRRKAYDKYKNPEYEFVYSCLKHIQKAQTIKSTTSNILLDRNSDINIIGKFHKHFKTSKKEIIDPELTNTIDQHFEQNQDINSWPFVFYNLYPILSEKQKKIRISAIETLQLDKIKEPPVWRILLYFSSNEKGIQRIKNGILSHPLLFHAGFKGDHISFSDPHISTNFLTSHQDTKNLKWTTDETLIIFNKIKQELSKIASSRRSDINFVNILEDMWLFVLLEKEVLAHIDDSQESIQEIQTLYFKHRGYSTLSQGLLSNIKEQVIWALSELITIIHNDTKRFEESDLMIVLHKVLGQSQPALEASIDFIKRRIISDNIAETYLKPHKELLNQILAVYMDRLPEDTEVPFVQKSMIDIALKLQAWEMSSDAIDYWLDVKETSHFNNIKFGY